MGRNGFLPGRNPFFREEMEETGKKLNDDINNNIYLNQPTRQGLFNI